MRRLFFLFVLALVLPATLATSRPAEAQRTRCFEQTGFCVSDPILSYWERNGGLNVFGYPVTELKVETNNDGWTGPTQWFERDRLEDHGAEGVLAGRLGAQLLELQGRPWPTSFPQVDNAPRGCRYFPETGHSLCPPFLVYWDQNGGLERFGYPITEQFNEQNNDGWTGTVQYFERRRMEHHIENRGTPYEILLGLLGREVLFFNQPPTAACQFPVIDPLQSAYSRVDFQQDMGCPQGAYWERPAAVQNFENGLMIWVDLGNGDRRIYAFFSWGGYKQYNDTWQEGDPDTPNVSPPGGLYAPRRGFGKVWINDPELRNQIGWAVEEFERAETATVQLFDNGTLVWLQGADTVYAFGPNEWNAQFVNR